MTCCRTANGSGLLGITVGDTGRIGGIFFRKNSPGCGKNGPVGRTPKRRRVRLTLYGLCQIAGSPLCLSVTGGFLRVEKIACHPRNRKIVTPACTRRRTPIGRRARTIKRTIHTTCLCATVTRISTLAKLGSCTGTLGSV